MRNLLQCLILIVFFKSTNVNAQESNYMQWWQNDKFGLFIHWGLYSVTAGEWQGRKAKGNEHIMYAERIPLKQYAELATQFNPLNYNAEFWVQLAKNAGMKYIVITAKHHDGFAMYNSPSDSYNIVKTTPYAKDPMKDLAAACKKHGIKLCFYYSLGRDWSSPDSHWDKANNKAGNNWDYPDSSKKDNARYIQQKVKPQLKELLTQYGPIGIIWFDTPEGTTPEQSKDLRNFIRTLQPDCIVNSRVGNGWGDYQVSEQKIVTGIKLTPWEACITMSSKWGFVKSDSTWKSPELLLRQLVEIVCKGGNFLLNVGPTPKGEIPKPAQERLLAIGNWMKINNEAIYGVKPWKILKESTKETTDTRNDAIGKSDNDFTSKEIYPDIYFSEKERAVYIYARSWEKEELVVKAMGKEKLQIRSITLLGSNKLVNWKQNPKELIINLPKNSLNNSINVFKVEQFDSN